MAWIIYFMTSLALLAMGVFITRMFAKQQVRRAAGLAVNMLWLAFAGFAFWSFKSPTEPVHLLPCQDQGAPLPWRGDWDAHVVGGGYDAGRMAINLLLWLLPMLAFWLLLLLHKPKAKLAPRPARA